MVYTIVLYYHSAVIALIVGWVSFVIIKSVIEIIPL